MRMNRRYFQSLLALTATLPICRIASADEGLRQRWIPGSEETLPIVGLGTNRYGVGENAEARKPLLAALQQFSALGGSFVDTAPAYRDSERVLGDLIHELGIREGLFLATKVHEQSPATIKQQLESSQANLRTATLDLVQVHNLRSWQTALPVLGDAKAAGDVRYVGITTSRTAQYDEMIQILKQEQLDFIQIDYSLEQRSAAETVIPLARDKGVGVIVNRAFGGGRLFDALGSEPLPAWAAEFGCESWAQFALKYVLSEPGVTVVIPGMTKTRHVQDNMAAGHGALPSAAQRAQMVELIRSI